MKSNFLVGLATAGYVLFFLLALPGMSGTWLFYPTDFWFCMAGCALVAIVFGSDTQRWVAILGLAFALIMGVYCWHHNRPIYQNILRLQHRQENVAPPGTNTTR